MSFISATSFVDPTTSSSTRDPVVPFSARGPYQSYDSAVTDTGRHQLRLLYTTLPSRWKAFAHLRFCLIQDRGRPEPHASEAKEMLLVYRMKQGAFVEDHRSPQQLSLCFGQSRVFLKAQLAYHSERVR